MANHGFKLKEFTIRLTRLPSDIIHMWQQGEDSGNAIEERNGYNFWRAVKTENIFGDVTIKSEPPSDDETPIDETLDMSIFKDIKEELIEEDRIENKIHLECDVCKKGFRKRRSLKSHLFRHAETKDAKHTEDSGNTMSYSEEKTNTAPLPQYKQGKADSKKKKNVKMRPICSVCNKTFGHQNYLKIYIRTHTGTKPYNCELCDRGFAQQSTLTRHRRTHSGEKPFRCGLCKKTFAQNFNLISHRRVHVGEKPFVCDVCEKRFTQKYCLLIHLRLHTGDRPYKCDFCGRSFAHKSNLSDHSRTHSGCKPYKCEVCDKGFAQRGNLIRHFLSHTGEKRFKCELCANCYTTRDSLSRHRRKHTGKNPFRHV